MSHLMSTQLHDSKCASTLALLSATHLRTSDESRSRQTPRTETTTTGSKTGPEHRPQKAPPCPTPAAGPPRRRDSNASTTGAQKGPPKPKHNTTHTCAHSRTHTHTTKTPGEAGPGTREDVSQKKKTCLAWRNDLTRGVVNSRSRNCHGWSQTSTAVQMWSGPDRNATAVVSGIFFGNGSLIAGTGGTFGQKLHYPAGGATDSWSRCATVRRGPTRAAEASHPRLTSLDAVQRTRS